MKDLNGHREEVERKADLLREKLMRTIDALDHRRHDMMDVGLQVRQHAGAAIAVGATVAVAIAGGVAYSAYRMSTRAQRRRRERIRAFGRLWRHPERLAKADQKPNVFAEIGRRVLIGTATFVAMALVRRFVQRALALPEPTPARRRPAELPG